MRPIIRKKIIKAQELIDEGMPVVHACKQAGVSMTAYYNNKNQKKKEFVECPKINLKPIEKKPRSLTPIAMLNEENKSLFMVKMPGESDLIQKLKAENASLRKFIKELI